ncbi:MAG: porin [Rhizobium sp.]|nr:porin [Rhizobium sp.]
MNIKSLLLGSAAALAVVSGAQAADAVVAAEPEPMEYVKVCDAYGTGFFYIPGTETCLKVSGQLRYEKRFKKVGEADATYDNHSRFRLNVEARNDSEWGTVYSWIRLQGDQVNNYSRKSGDWDSETHSFPATGSKGINWYYYFGIGGLEFGNWDSQWAKFFAYGGFTDDGGVYTNDWDIDRRQYVSYTAEFGSVKAYVSLDNDADEFYATQSGHKYMPDVTAGASATIGDWQVAGGVAYDESDESFALKGLIAGNFGMFGVRFMPQYSNSDTNIYQKYDGFNAIIGLQAKVTDTVTLYKDIQFWDNGDWRVVGDVSWQVASGFSVLVEGVYADRFDVKTKSGMLRFQRSF